MSFAGGSRRKSRRSGSRSRSRSRSRKVLLPHPRKGALSKTYAGKYSTHDSATHRHKVLSADVNSLGYAETVRSLNLIAILTKNQSPEASEKIRADMEWLRKKYRGSKSSRSRRSKK